MALIKKIQDMKYEMTRWRQKLHGEPELAFKESATARYINRQLQSFGVETHAFSKTGVIGVLHGKNGPASLTGGKTIMLRADMDALPMKDETGTHYASQNGAHHGSGHDGHMAMLMGAAKYLAQTKNFDGTVYFVFQPGEEQAGASGLIDDEDLFQQFPCDEVYGLHSHPDVPLGTMVSAEGVFMAAAEEFNIVLRGNGGHPSRPDNKTDVIGAMAEVIALVKELADKGAEASSVPSLLSISSVRTEGAANDLFPASAHLHGNIRTLDPSLHERAHKSLEKLAQEVSFKYNVDLKVDFSSHYPLLLNSKLQTEFARAVAKDTVGDANVSDTPPRLLDVDDLSCYLQEVPGNLMILGTGKNDGKPEPDIYTSKYDFNDAALPVGTTYWVKLTEARLPTFSAPAPKAPDAPKP